MVNIQRLLAVILLMTGHLAFGQEVTVIPSSPESKAAVAAKVHAAAIAKDPSQIETLLKAPVLCGPRLWQILRSTMPTDKTRVGTAMLIYDTASGRESWGIQPLDRSTLSEDVRKVVNAAVDSQPGRIAVESGVFRGSGVEILASALRERFLKGVITVTQASAADLGYYWLMIPYDIEEPVLRLDTSQGSLLLDVDQDGRITWIDLLPPDVVEAGRAHAPSQSPNSAIQPTGTAAPAWWVLQ